jgi:hypothetical protein
MGEEMKNKLFLYSLLASFTLHLSLVGAMQVDWNLKEQFLGLKQVVSEMMESVRNTETTKLPGKVADSISKEIEEVSQALKEGKKLRIGPGNPAWKELDQKLAQQKALEEQKQLAENKKQKQGQGSGGFNRFIPPVEVSLVETPKVEEPTPEETPDPDSISLKKVEFKSKCDKPGFKTYGGIGVSFASALNPQLYKQLIDKKISMEQFQSLSNNSHEVSEVAVGYPAHKAGIKKGDVIKGDPLRFRGPEGSSVQVEVFRNNQKLTFNLQRVKICYEEKASQIPKSQ